MILGLDISTSKIGIALVDDEKVLLHSNLIKFKTADMTLEERAEHFMIVMDKYKKKGHIDLRRKHFGRGCRWRRFRLMYRSHNEIYNLGTEILCKICFGHNSTQIEALVT